MRDEISCVGLQLQRISADSREAVVKADLAVFPANLQKRPVRGRGNMCKNEPFAALVWT